MTQATQDIWKLHFKLKNERTWAQLKVLLWFWTGKEWMMNNLRRRSRTCRFTRKWQSCSVGFACFGRAKGAAAFQDLGRRRRRRRGKGRQAQQGHVIGLSMWRRRAAGEWEKWRGMARKGEGNELRRSKQKEGIDRPLPCLQVPPAPDFTPLLRLLILLLLLPLPLSCFLTQFFFYFFIAEFQK